MKKVLLLSLLIPTSFVPSLTQADARHTAGITTAIVSGVSGLLSGYVGSQKSKTMGEAMAQGMVAAGAGLVSIGSGLASFALLNPTSYNTVTVVKLEVATCLGLLAASMGALSIKSYISSLKEDKPVDLRLTHEDCIPSSTHRECAITGAKFAAGLTALAAGAVYSALDSNWHLKA